jgi:hypothetical protein
LPGAAADACAISARSAVSQAVLAGGQVEYPEHRKPQVCDARAPHGLHGRIQGAASELRLAVGREVSVTQMAFE